MYQEHAQRVERERKCVEAGTVQPYFVITHRRQNILPRYALVGYGVAVRLQASGD